MSRPLPRSRTDFEAAWKIRFNRGGAFLTCRSDTIDRDLSGDIKYYGSVDLIDARHPQTILAYGLNSKALPAETVRRSGCV